LTRIVPNFDLLADVRQHPAARFFGGALDGTLESKRVSGAVALDDNPFQPEELAPL